MDLPAMEPSGHFRFCPACGGAGAGERGASPFRCASCGFTFYFNAAIATAAFIPRHDDGRVLLIRRAREPGKGLLAPPGGFVDIGERAEEAVRREVREEVGLELVGVRFLASFPNRYFYRDVTYPVLDFFFRAEAVDAGRARALEDAESLVWLDAVREVRPEELAFPSMRAALEVFRAEGDVGA
jgi:ADP-ribose pyrophosphatase YjhB (NUDIX family)